MLFFLGNHEYLGCSCSFSLGAVWEFFTVAVYRILSCQNVIIASPMVWLTVFSLSARLLSSLSDAFAVMIFEEGFFHADPHPGNVFVMPLVQRRKKTKHKLFGPDMRRENPGPKKVYWRLFSTIKHGALGTNLSEPKLFGCIPASKMLMIKDQGRKCAINNFWTKNPRGLLGSGSRGSRQIIYVRIFPNI